MTDDMIEKLDPGTRLRPGCGTKGIPLKVAGMTWILPDGRLLKSLDQTRDAMFDEIVIRSEVDVEQCRLAAMVLLSTRYDLDLEEMVAICVQADNQQLADAVTTALFGEPQRYTYTEWLVSALRSNGLDPEKIPADELDGVMRQLVLTGRAASKDDFVTSAVHAAKRRELSGIIQR